MNFLSGIFLWALPLAAIPVAIHLWNRRRREVIGWGAMQLLMESAPRKRRIWRLDDLLLMLLRTLAIAAIIVALARPQIRSGLLAGTRSGRDVILVVDASLSTGRLQNGAPVFDSIKRQSITLLDRLDETDYVRLLLAAPVPHWLTSSGPPAESVTKETKATIAEQLSAWQPTLASADMPACVQAALQSESPPDVTGRLIVVVTDGVAHGWNADAGFHWRAIHQAVLRSAVPTVINVVSVDEPAADVVNLSIEQLTTNRTRVATDEPFTLTAHVQNTGAASHAAAILTWTIDGEPLGESAVQQLEPGQTTEVTFETICDGPGVFEISCSFGVSDDLPGDNASSVVVESLEQLPILICRAVADLAQTDSQPDFLNAALGHGPGPQDGADSFSVLDGPTVFRPTVVGIDTLGDSDLTRYRCVVLDNILPRSADDIDDLTDFVHDGGGLWLILGENIAAEEFNALFFQEEGELSPLAINRRVEADDDDEGSFTIHPPEGTHPATVLLGDTERLDIDDVRIERRWEFSPPTLTEPISVLLETGDGAPLVVEQFLGDGRIIVQALPCDTQWSNLPVCQVFVPLIQEWIWYLTQPTAVDYNVEAGTPIVIVPQAPQLTGESTVLTPMGETVVLNKADLHLGGEFRYRGTTFPGSYRVTLSGQAGDHQQLPYYVRREADESRLASLSAGQIVRLTQAGGLRFGIDPLAGPKIGVENVRYHPFWNFLLFLVVLLFVAEFIVTFLLTKNRYADVAQPEKVVVAPSHGHAGVPRRSA